ncbi:hypothetical protein TNCV_3460411 [Trichonephila clavipes]|nr:hypothetical protein TNCV_3460411 [Trichonephila clavipes]
MYIQARFGSYRSIESTKTDWNCTIPTKHSSHASRILSSSQSSSCHSAERKTPLSPCPSSKTCPDMGLRTASQSRRPKKQRLCNVYATTGIVRGKAFLHVLRRRPIGCPDSRKRTL